MISREPPRFPYNRVLPEAPMSHTRRLSLGIVLTFALSKLAVGDAGHTHTEGDPTKLGKVHFEISCGAASQPKFDVALAMLHSFWYSKAEKAFSDLAASDP